MSTIAGCGVNALSGLQKTCKFKMLKYILLACFAFVSVSRRVTAPNYCNPGWGKISLPYRVP
ncbi:hypothetical protein J4U98_16440, partial [Escherichia coli]